MKQEWTDYLHSIGVVDHFYEKAERVVLFYENLFPNDINEIFVSEYVDKEGMRQYDNIWLFTSEVVLEAKAFLKKDDYDATPLRGCLKYWNITKEEFEIGSASKKSRMTLMIGMTGSVRGEMKASAENCDHLWSIFTKAILPNLCKASED